MDLENQWGEDSFSYVSVHRSNVKSIVKTWSVQSSMRTLNTITVVLLYTEEIGSRVLWSKPPVHWENVSLSLLIKCRLTDSEADFRAEIILGRRVESEEPQVRHKGSKR